MIAALSFAAGLYLLVAPLNGAFTLTVVLSMWFLARIATGIADHNVPGAGMLALNGVLSLVLGLLIALQLPESATWAIGLLVGIDLLFTGMLLLTGNYHMNAVHGLRLGVLRDLRCSRCGTCAPSAMCAKAGYGSRVIAAGRFDRHDGVRCRVLGTRTGVEDDDAVLAAGCFGGEGDAV
jgi:hypothetical protein